MSSLSERRKRKPRRAPLGFPTHRRRRVVSGQLASCPSLPAGLRQGSPWSTGWSRRQPRHSGGHSGGEAFSLPPVLAQQAADCAGELRNKLADSCARWASLTDRSTRRCGPGPSSSRVSAATSAGGLGCAGPNPFPQHWQCRWPCRPARGHSLAPRRPLSGRLTRHPIRNGTVPLFSVAYVRSPGSPGPLQLSVKTEWRHLVS